jgi:hypothetical protein
MDDAAQELVEQIWQAGVEEGPIAGRMILNRISKSDPNVRGMCHNPACAGLMFNVLCLFI